MIQSENPIGAIVGYRVLTSYFEGSVTIDIGDESQYIIYIESEFEFWDGKDVFRIKGTPYDDEMLHLQAQKGMTVREAHAGEDGCLIISFGESCRLTCEADDNYEAWRIVGPQGFRVVSLAAGGLMVWDAV